MGELNAAYPWRVEWIEYPSGIHYDKQFLIREMAERFFAEFLSDRDRLEQMHSVALQFLDFMQPGACFVYSVKVYRNYPENERRVRK